MDGGETRTGRCDNSLCRCCRSFFRSVPVSAIVAFLFSAVGIALGVMSVDKVEHAADVVRKAGDYDADPAQGVGFSKLLLLPALATVLANGLALVVAFLGTGRTAEEVFAPRPAKGEAELGGGGLRCLRCCFGVCFVRLVQVLLLLVYVVQVLLSYALLLICVAVLTLGAVCQGGLAIIDDFKKLTHDLKEAERAEGRTGTKSLFDAVKDVDLDTYCAAVGDLDWAAVYLFLGCVVALLGTGPMMACLSTAKERIRCEMRRRLDGTELLEKRLSADALRREVEYHDLADRCAEETGSITRLQEHHEKKLAELRDRHNEEVRHLEEQLLLATAHVQKLQLADQLDDDGSGGHAALYPELAVIGRREEDVANPQYTASRQMALAGRARIEEETPRTGLLWCKPACCGA